MKNKNIQLSELLTASTSDFVYKHRRCRRKLSTKNVHDLRVATQRMEAILSLTLALEPTRCGRRLIKILKKIRKRLGPVRDLQIEIQEQSKIKAKENSQKLLRNLDKSLSKRTRRAQACLKSVRLKRIKWKSQKIDDSISLLEKDTPQVVPAGVRKVLSASAAKFERLSSGSRFNMSEKNHTFRKAVKQLRYQIEAAQTMMEMPKGALNSLKLIQDLTGQIQDRQVMKKHLRYSKN